MLRPETISLVLYALLSQATQICAVWPLPRQFNTGSVGLRLGNNFSIHLSGPLEYNAPPDLRDAISRTLVELRDNRMERLSVGGASADAFRLSHAESLNTLRLEITSPTSHQIPSISQNSILPLGERNEAYTLRIPSDGSAATLKALSTLGLFRGLTTFLQLWYWSGSVSYTVQAPIDIEDTPAYVSWE